MSAPSAVMTAATETVPTPTPRRDTFWIWWLGLSIAALVGALLIGASYRQAIQSAPHQYLLFWAGVLLVMVPVSCFVAAARVGRSARLVVIAASGLFLYIPKILRNPFGPTYHDELAHWRQVQDIAASGHLFVPNTTIPIISSYPGLHIVTLTVQELSGLSTWSSAMILLAIFHVVDLLAVFLIVEGFTSSSRVGAIGALLYSSNSSYMYFHTQFAYESLGIVLFLVTIVAVQRAERATSRLDRTAWVAIAVLVGASCAVTHHLSTACLCLLLIVWSAIAVRRARRRPETAASGRAILTITVSITGLFAIWVIFVARNTVTYLRPYFGQAVSQLSSTLRGRKGSRAPFSAAVNPPIERLAAFAAPLLMLVIAALTVLYLQRRRPGRPTRWRLPRTGLITLFVFGLLYFPSIPFLLAPSGAEGARRSWGFTYLGVVLIVAPTVARWLQRARRSPPRARRRLRALLAAAFVMILVGNVAAGLDESYRFPGPYALGSDTGSQTPELAALASWFSATVGPENKVVADRFTALDLAAFGRQVVDAPSSGFPTYQLWLDRSPPSPTLVDELSTSGYRYLVIDKRMTLTVADLAGFFSTGSASSSDGTATVTAADLNRFATYGWLSRVYESTDFAVYRFQFESRQLAPTEP